MSPDGAQERDPEAGRRLVRVAIGGAAIAVLLTGFFQMRAADWPIYAIVAALTVVLTAPPVRILPDLSLPVPLMAAMSGFLYIGGLPILVVNFAVDLVMSVLVRVLPPEVVGRVRPLRLLRDFRSSPSGSRFGPMRVVNVEHAVFIVGLAARWWVATAVTGGEPIWTSVVAIAIAEVVGYSVWGGLSFLPVFPDRPLFPLAGSQEQIRPLIGDIALTLQIVVTAFIYLIVYSYAETGLLGAGTFAVASLAVLLVLERLNDRRLQLEEQNRTLARLNRELEHRERLSAIGKMASVVSHQILQQLGVIGIYANLVRTASTDGSAPESALARTRLHGAAIEGALEDVNRVLRDLLVFSRDLRVNPYHHEVVSLLEEAAAAARPTAEEHGVRLRVECPGDLGAELDKLKMKQALENVLRNAIDASPAGGEVVVGARRDGDVLEVFVTDEGAGVPLENREAIFTPFFTTKENGSGLGLAIAREFTRAHGGDVDVVPGAGGRGARFRLRLPVGGDAGSSRAGVPTPSR
ncbi:MAG: HAMP domain-containing histidine kinase [Deltaproteobacteria bacterium]|nr:HAMP domain-containing histidine kinase [Deltaproteobacteria bacterium]